MTKYQEDLNNYIDNVKALDECTQKIQQYNRQLAYEFPFLYPYNAENYDYSYTILDSIPLSWRQILDKDFLERIKEDLSNYSDNYRIVYIGVKEDNIEVLLQRSDKNKLTLYYSDFYKLIKDM